MRMTPQEIVKNSDWVKKYGWDWKELYATLYMAQENSNEFRILRENNTIFFIQIVTPGVANVDVFNADPDNTFKKNIVVAINALKTAGYKQLTFTSQNVMDLNAVRRAGIQIDVSSNGKDAKGHSTFVGVVHV